MAIARQRRNKMSIVISLLLLGEVGLTPWHFDLGNITLAK